MNMDHLKGTFTLARAQELMEQLIEEKGEDFVYSSADIRLSEHDLGDNCYNVPLSVARRNGWYHLPPIEGDPRETTGCIVGTIMSRYGMVWEKSSMDGAAECADDLFLESERKAITAFLTAAQLAQDDGATWGAARAAAYVALDRLSEN